MKSIARDIESGSVRNAVAAMDRDFDHINGRLISSENVMYTHGYSWENDAWNEITIYEAFCSLSGSCRTNTESDAEFISLEIETFFSRIRGAIRIDVILSQYGNSLFDREKPGKYVLIEKSGSPKINTGQLVKSLADARLLNGRPVSRKTKLVINSRLDCFGHLLAEYAYRVIAYLVEQRHRLPKIPKEYASCMIVEKFGPAFFDELFPALKRHYDSQFARLRP